MVCSCQMVSARLAEENETSSYFLRSCSISAAGSDNRRAGGSPPSAVSHERSQLGTRSSNRRGDEFASRAGSAGSARRHRRKGCDDRLVLPVLGELEQFVFRQLAVLHQPLDKRQCRTKVARTFRLTFRFQCDGLDTALNFTPQRSRAPWPSAARERRLRCGPAVHAAAGPADRRAARFSPPAEDRLLRLQPAATIRRARSLRPRCRATRRNTSLSPRSISA